MGAFTFRLELRDDTPAEPPVFRTAVPNWIPGDTIPLGPDRTVRVVGIVVSKDDEPSVLIIEDVSSGASSAAPRGPVASPWAGRRS